jgi:hypothetical protein
MPILVNDTLQNNSPKALDGRTGKFTGGVWQPFASIAEANTLINPAYRNRSLTVSILVGGVNTEHWYRDGTADNQLIVKNAAGATGALTSTSNTVYFTNGANGVIHGTWATPITGNIVLNGTGALEGSCAVIIYSGSTTPNITGGTIQSLAGEITQAGTYSIYIQYLLGRYNINIFNTGGTQGSNDTIDPTVGILSYAGVGATGATLNWTAGADNTAVTGYKVYKDGVLHATLGNVLTTDLTGLSNNTEYDFHITAFDGAGNESAISNVVTFTTLDPGDVTPPAQITDFYLQDLNGDLTPPAQIGIFSLTDLNS